MKINEEDIIKEIENINNMLKVICVKLNNYEDIDDFEIELNEISEQWCLDERKQKEYKIMVSTKRNINN